ncbi:unnamed protein product [Peniophora sp. CBMAI 1063]|nr:unnamed protein product [Peniophora sp. CBMAI 1063]
MRSTSTPYIPSSITDSMAHRRTMTHGSLERLFKSHVPPDVTPRLSFQPPGLQFHPFVPPEPSTRAPSPVLSDLDGSIERTHPDNVARWLGVDSVPRSADAANNESNARTLNPNAEQFRLPMQDTSPASLPAPPPFRHPPPGLPPPVLMRPPPTSRQFTPSAGPMPDPRMFPPPPPPVYHSSVPQLSPPPPMRHSYAPPRPMPPPPMRMHANPHFVPPSAGPPFPQRNPPPPPFKPTPMRRQTAPPDVVARQGPPVFQPDPELVPEYQIEPLLPPIPEAKKKRSRHRRSVQSPEDAPDLDEAEGPSSVFEETPPSGPSEGESFVYAYSAVNRRSRQAGARYSIWWGPDDVRNRTSRVEAHCEIDGALLAIVLAVEDALPYALDPNTRVVVITSNTNAADVINSPRVVSSSTEFAATVSTLASYHIRTLIAAASAHITVRAHPGVRRHRTTKEWAEPQRLASEAATAADAGLPRLVLDGRRRVDVLGAIMGKSAARRALARVEALQNGSASPKTAKDDLADAEEQDFHASEKAVLVADGDEVGDRDSSPDSSGSLASSEELHPAGRNAPPAIGDTTDAHSSCASPSSAKDDVLDDVAIPKRVIIPQFKRTPSPSSNALPPLDALVPSGLSGDARPARRAVPVKRRGREHSDKPMKRRRVEEARLPVVRSWRKERRDPQVAIPAQKSCMPFTRPSLKRPRSPSPAVASDSNGMTKEDLNKMPARDENDLGSDAQQQPDAIGANPIPDAAISPIRTNQHVTTVTPRQRSAFNTLLVFAVALTIFALILASPAAIFELSIYPLRI